MTSVEEADSWIGRTAIDNNGKQIGMITQIWVDDASGRPEWASVRSAAPEMREVLVPLAGAAALGGGRQFAYSREQVIDAPRVDQLGHLELADKERISSYYGEPGNGPAAAGSAGRNATGSDPTQVSPGSGVAPQEAAPPAKPAGRRFGRKHKAQAGRRFGRRSRPADRGPTAMPLEADEVPLGR